MLSSNYIPVFKSHNVTKRPYEVWIEPTGDLAILMPGDKLTVYQDCDEYSKSLDPLGANHHEQGIQIYSFNDYRLFVNERADTGSDWVTQKMIDFCDYSETILTLSLRTIRSLRNGTFVARLNGQTDETKIGFNEDITLPLHGIQGMVIGSGAYRRWFFRWRHVDFPEHYPDARTVFEQSDEDIEGKNLEIIHYLLPRDSSKRYAKLWNIDIITTLEQQLSIVDEK